MPENVPTSLRKPQPISRPATVKSTDDQQAPKKDQRAWFEKVSQKSSAAAGHPIAFMAALASLVLWGLLGPHFHYSDTWQLVINTATSLCTFLMVFVLQNSQNRDTRAIHLKLDELIRAMHPAHNEMIDIEKLSESELKQLADRYEAIKQEWHSRQSELDERETESAEHDTAA